MATKRKKKNVKMKTGENRPKDKRPCISSKGREKEGHDGVANAKMAKNVDATTKMNSTDDNHGPSFANVVKNLNSDGIVEKNSIKTRFNFC
ncbi:hypothetical protein HNY73_010015 [Argiope bruennichi]|uniref:Uncharacterized protein n=1 Tax=Argiope bruennichi TaxID=94029 RepID=A0A8T0F4J1_ARGBR|nr:hypothetical protein HNY73_010015 [Argiope bruennichi]